MPRTLAPNPVRTRLAEGSPAFGMSLRSGSPTMAEMLAAMDFDFVFIDMEHTPASVETVVGLMASIEARGGSPWVRVPYFDVHIIGKIAELGAHGIVVPHLDSAEQAQAAVEAIRWPPAGTMGVGTRVRQACGTWNAKLPPSVARQHAGAPRVTRLRSP